jgi:tRNA pseudouridine38-40 synthase
VPRFTLTVAYDGSGLVGWQRQANGTSIQGLLEDALAVLDAAPVTVIGAGRTDAGVHALGQVATATLTRPIDAATLVRALNAQLPAAVRVLDAIDVAPTFHPQFQARRKTYCYRIWHAAVLTPFARPYVWHVRPPPLDLDAMADAAARLVGHHDFASFQSAPPIARTTERELFSSRLLVGEAGVSPAGDAFLSSTAHPDSAARGPLLTYEVCGDGFMRHMVRTIVGTLIEIGRGRQRADWMSDVIAARDRTAAGPTAPPHGLFLVKVDY